MFHFIIIGIALLSSFFTFLKSSPMIWDWDFSYFIENSYRVYIGQIPYKDFVLVLTPGTYYIGALIMKIFGTSYNFQIIYIMTISFFTVILSYGILGFFSNKKKLNAVLLLPLLFSGHTIYRFPSYDINSVFFVLLGIYFLLTLHHEKNSSLFSYFFSGMLISLPFLFKQNTGAVYLILMLLLEYIHIYFFERKKQIQKATLFTGGSLLIFILFVFYLLYNHSISQFVFQAFTFPLKARNVGGVISLFFFDATRTRSIFYYIPYIEIVLLIALRKAKNITVQLLVLYSVVISPFVYQAYLYLRYPALAKDIFFTIGRSYLYIVSIWFVIFISLSLLLLRDLIKKRLINKKNILFFSYSLFFLLFSLSPFTIHRVEGALFGFYPFFAILLVHILARLRLELPKYNWEGVVIIISFGVTLFLSFYMFQNEIIRYFLRKGVEVKPISDIWISEDKNMISYVNKNIPIKDSIISIPGQNTFYYLTKRTPSLPYFQYISPTFPYTSKDYSNQIEKTKIDWVIIENSSKYDWNPVVMDVNSIATSLKERYILYKQIKGFDIYRRSK